MTVSVRDANGGDILHVFAHDLFAVRHPPFTGKDREIKRETERNRERQRGSPSIYLSN